MGVITDIPPVNIDAEEAVLGAILINPDAIVQVAPALSGPGDFTSDRGAIYKAMLDLHAAGRDLDAVTLFDLLEKRGHLQGNKGLARLTKLIEAVPSSLHAEDYAELVASYAVRRRIINAAGDVAKEAYNLKSADPVGYMQARVLEVATAQEKQTPPLRDIVGHYYDQVEQWANNPLEIGEVRGLDLGLPSVNQLVDGVDRGLIMLAGRPSMGKSALAFELARRVAESGGRVVLFSLEMAAEAVVGRWASAISGVQTRKARRGVCPRHHRGKPAAQGYITSADLTAYMEALGTIDGYRHLYIDDASSLSASDIRARALQKANLWGGLELVVVDHTGYIKSDRMHGENSAQTEGRKSRILKQLGKGDLGCPVLQVQQLNRNVEQRDNKRPQLSDLRQTGEHEENADVVLAVYRESYYLEREGKPVPSHEQNRIELIGLKNREGPTGTRFLYYDRTISRFGEEAKS